jgi:copper resistance protein C
MKAKNHMSKIRAYALVLATILYGDLVYAHPQLQSAEPAAGAGIASPKEVRITFNEPVIARFSGIELKDQSGKLIATGKSETDAANKKILIVPVKEQLAPGAYSVEWHAVSEDTHRVKGSYSFSVTR